MYIYFVFVFHLFLTHDLVHIMLNCILITQKNICQIKKLSYIFHP